MEALGRRQGERADSAESTLEHRPGQAAVNGGGHSRWVGPGMRWTDSFNVTSCYRYPVTACYVLLLRGVKRYTDPTGAWNRTDGSLHGGVASRVVCPLPLERMLVAVPLRSHTRALCVITISAPTPTSPGNSLPSRCRALEPYRHFLRQHFNAQPRCRTWQWSRHIEPHRC